MTKENNCKDCGHEDIHHNRFGCQKMSVVIPKLSDPNAWRLETAECTCEEFIGTDKSRKCKRCNTKTECILDRGMCGDCVCLEIDES
jgi:hypothetical protein